MNELMRVLEQLLIEIEPLRYAKRQEINRLVQDKQAWGEKYNRTCSNSNEMWFYTSEYRRSLEQEWEPLNKAVKEANIVFDEINKEREIYIEDY